LLDNTKPKDFIRKERLSWDDFFMQMAITVAERTACLFHKAGSVFVDDHHRIISVGFNGASTGDYHCSEVGCAKVHGDPSTGKLKRCRGVHGEINAIMNAGDTQRLRGSTLYTTLFPCYDCMKALNNVGVKKIIYYEEYLRILDGSDGKKESAEPEAKELADERGILLEKYKK
jgi:dCMP deaminase